MDLSQFNHRDKSLFDAATHLFEQLKIPLNSITTESMTIENVLKNHCKENDTYKAVINTHFLGLIDDSVFSPKTLFSSQNYTYPEALEKANEKYEGFMLFAVELKKYPKRTEIAELTRAFNRLSLKMPVALLLKYPPTSLLEGESFISIALSERFKYLQNWRQGEKVGKVIILRDIHTRKPHAGHLRILQDLSAPAEVKDFNALHKHWLRVLDVEILNKKFFRELSNWYFAAMNEVSFPDDVEKDPEVRNATNLIRLLTRIIFIWFIKEKGLVPEWLFKKEKIAKILKDFLKDKNAHNYYNAILQNLFFGTLNQIKGERRFAQEGDFITNKEEYGVKNLFRYADLFTIPEDEVLKLFNDIPFLNGGLFDCLDKLNEEKKIEYVDGFSRNPKKKAIVPDHLFFGEEREVDLNAVYGTRNKAYRTRGLIPLLESYKFTVAENTPLEEEVALDPELLGKVFENLLASYNPETQTTARKQTGSFYTPQQIVDYMVEESLLEHLKTKLIGPHQTQNNLTIHGQAQGNLTILGQAQDTPTTHGQAQSTPTIHGQDPNSELITPDEYYSFFNPENEITIQSGNLPHWQQKNVWYFVTFRLADSLPADVVESIREERELWLKNNKKNESGQYTKEQKKEYHRLFSERIEQLLDNGWGSCVLKDPKIARIVADTLQHFNNVRYVLDAWVIMPNHVHVLVKPLENYTLPDITHSWKSYTANKINEVLGRTGQLWMHESYDHIVRNERAFEAIRQYIRQNPVKAQLREGEYLLSEGRVNDVRSRDASDTMEGRLRRLLSYADETYPFTETEIRKIIEAISECKILDPACGSGAFPMGILHKMVHILQKLDPDNKYWKEVQEEKILGPEINKLKQDKKIIESLSDEQVKEKARKAVEDRLKELEEIFNREHHLDDYSRKLYLIENCIYGVDIQPIAVQIAKLRFFISLVIEQKVDTHKENFGIRSLPNLETKFVAANTLIGLDRPQQLTLRNPKIEEKESELKELRHQYFTASTRKEKLALQKQDKQLRKEIADLLKKDGWPSASAEQIASFDPYNQNQAAGWFDPEWMFGITEGFDIVIGNPPYISTKGVNEQEKKLLEKNFGFADDTYSHFFFKGIELLKPDGILSFISSKTFWTIQTKKNLRELLLKNKILQIFDTANPFASAMVDTCVMIVQKQEALKNHEIVFLDGRENISEPEKYTVKQEVYQNAPNEVFFNPTPYNMKIYEKLGKTVNKLIKEWWDKISTSKNIEKNKRVLEEYRRNLKPGDITLLGLITEGGVGIQTGNNGKYIGVLDGTKWAEKVRKERPEKLLLATDFCQKQKITTKLDAQSFLENLNEQEIRQLFDQIKEQYGRDIFGQGWLYRIVSKEEIADVEKLTDDEKLNGINGNKTFVPYDKGDKDGNRWYAPTPYYIDWSRENVKALQTDPKARWQGYQFYFREGFCWNNVTGEKIICRLKEKSVHSTEAMTFISVVKILPDFFLVCLLNSNFFSYYKNLFLNVTVHLTTGDAKEFPIIIPTATELAAFEKIFNRAYTIQKQKFAGTITEAEAERELEEVQRELDKMVEEMYMGKVTKKEN